MLKTFSNVEVGDIIRVKILSGSTSRKYVCSVLATINETCLQLLFHDPFELPDEICQCTALYTKDVNSVTSIFKGAILVKQEQGYFLNIEPKQTNSERRAYPRHDREIRAVIAYGTHIATVLLHDVSVQGFSIVDSLSRLSLTEVTNLICSFEDMDMLLSVAGNRVRVDKQLDKTLYGFRIYEESDNYQDYIKLLSLKEGL